MSMSTYVVAIRPPDQRWEQMKAVWDASRAARVTIPQEVLDFFGDEDPDPQGVLLPLEPGETPGVHEWHDTYRSGIEAMLSDLPPDVKIIRFYNSW